MYYARDNGVVWAVIPTATSLSQVLRLPSQSTVVALQMPAAWDAANITFLAGVAGEAGLVQSVYLEGTELSIPVAASRYVQLLDGSNKLLGVQYLQLRSGTEGLAVPQLASRTIGVIFT